MRLHHGSGLTPSSATGAPQPGPLMDPAVRRLSRRGALAAAAAVLAGCAREPADEQRHTDGVSPGESGAPEGDPSPAAEPPASSTPADGRAPGDEPAEVVEALQGEPAADWGLNLPGTVTTTGTDAVALTFDACGGPTGSAVDHALLELLRHEQIPATLFLNARWIEANPSLARELAGDPLFLLASHGQRHLPLSVSGRSAYGIPGTQGIDEVVEELTATDDWFREHTGGPALWFRSGTAYTDDVSVRAAEMLGRAIAGFSVNGDGGAQFSSTQVAQELAALEPGGIVLAHMNQPAGGTAEGLAAALPGLRDRGLEFAALPTDPA